MYEKIFRKNLRKPEKSVTSKSVLSTAIKNYVSYFLNYVDKAPEKLTCQDVRDFLLAKKERRAESDHSESLQFRHPLFFTGMS